MNQFKPYGIIFILAVSILLASCDMIESVFTGEEAVTIKFPELPQAAVLSGIKEPARSVRWFDSDGKPMSKTLSGSHCTLWLKKGSFTPVIVELADTDPRTGPFPAAGSIYPALATVSYSGVQLAAGYAGGVAALAAEKALLSATGGIEAGRSIIASFNWCRLVQEVEKLAYPHNCDYSRLVTAMLSGQVRVYDIRMRSSRAYKMMLPQADIPSGTLFYTVWPGIAAFIWPVSASVSVEIPEGITRFYSSKGCITVHRGGLTGDSCFFMPYSLQE